MYLPVALLALFMSALSGVIFRGMALKGWALYVCLWEFDREHLKNNANNGRRWRGRCNKDQQGIPFKCIAQKYLLGIVSKFRY